MNIVPVLFVGPVQGPQFCGAPHHDHIGNTDREVPVHLAALRDISNTDMPARTRAEDAHFTGRRLQHTGDHLEQRALPGAIRPNHRDALSLMQVKSDVVKRLTPVIAKSDVPHIEDGLVSFVMSMEVLLLFSNYLRASTSLVTLY